MSSQSINQLRLGSIVIIDTVIDMVILDVGL